VTVREAMNLLGLNERQLSLEALDTALQRERAQRPLERGALEAAHHRLRIFLNPTEDDRFALRETPVLSALAGSAQPTQSPRAEQFQTQEIFLFDENRDIVRFDDEPAPYVEAKHTRDLLEDEIVILERDAASPPQRAQPETGLSGEWQLMLESLEAEGLMRVSGDAKDFEVPDQPSAHPDNWIAPLEPRGPGAPPTNASLLETPLFFADPAPARPQPPSPSPLETPLFLEAPTPSTTPAVDTHPLDSVTFDGALLVTETQVAAPQIAVPRAALNVPVKRLDDPGARKTVSAQLKRGALEVLPSEPPVKVVPVGRSAASALAGQPERRAARGALQPARTYRDAREPESQVRRAQPVWLWIGGALALIASALLVMPNLARQLTERVLPAAATRVAAPTPERTQPAPVAQPKALTPRPGATTKPSAAQPATTSVAATPKPSAPAQKPATPAPTTSPRPAAAKPAPSPSSVNTAAPPRGVTAPAAQGARAATSAKPTPKATPAPRTGAAALPPVTRPEGFSTVPKRTEPARSSAPKATASAPSARVAPPPPPAAPVAAIEYRAPAAEDRPLPGGLTREQYGRQFINRKQFETWQAQGSNLRYANWSDLPLETQVLEPSAFRQAVLIQAPPLRPARPERP
jgi:hypothetical protein